MKSKKKQKGGSSNNGIIVVAVILLLIGCFIYVYYSFKSDKHIPYHIQGVERETFFPPEVEVTRAANNTEPLYTEPLYRGPALTEESDNL